jgi:cell division protein ZapA
MSQKNIKIKIGDRVYPLTVSENEEKTVEISAEQIAENIKKLKIQYKISDSQDLLAMTCLELATKLQSVPKTEVKPTPDNTKKLDDLLGKLEEALS